MHVIIFTAIQSSLQELKIEHLKVKTTLLFMKRIVSGDIEGLDALRNSSKTGI